MSVDLDLSRELTRLVQAVEGVYEVYAAGSLGEMISLSAVNAISGAETDDAKVAVSRGDGTVDIHANICVRSDHSVPTTLRDVSDAIAAHVTTRADSEAAHIFVKASRIE